MLTIKITGLKEMQEKLGKLGRQVPFAASRALNVTAAAIQKATYEEMRKRFDRPTPYTFRSMAVARSTKANLTAIVGLRTDAPGKGIPWNKALGHEFTGGTRAWRKFEAALNRVGILPSGMGVVPPNNPSWAITLDQYGNVPRGLIVTLISYFQAFGEQGYKANSTDKSRKRRAKYGRTASGYRSINGVVYFVSYGRRGRSGGDRFVNGRHDQHLAAGIWAKRGIHGVDVAPVLLYVRRPNYQRRIDLERIARDIVSRDFTATFNRELQAAIASAR